jgi:Fur family ferric uptake transcriptional regulator/Fur family peroxide stress response transcriptional regulator
MHVSTSAVIEHLTAHDIRPSAQRIAIMRYLMENRVHPSADTIYSELITENPTLSRTTVYNTLWLLADKNAVLALTIDRNNTRFDYSEHPHAHFLCHECGQIFDVPANMSPIIQSDSQTTLHVEQMYIHYIGLCGKCQQKLQNI